TVVALTAAMPGPTGLLAFAGAYPDRFFDVGIAEAHAVTAAAGMATGGLRPVVAIYSTFFSRAFDQANLDVGLHRAPVVFAIPSAGITGVDGPSHHGVLDLAQCLSIPGMVVFAPSSPAEVADMLACALSMDSPCSIRFPKTPYLPSIVPNQGSGDHVSAHSGDGPATAMAGLKLRTGDGSVCVLAVGKLVVAAYEAASLLEASGVEVTVWDVRVVRPADPSMLADAARHDLVVTVEDGIRIGGAGSHLVDAVSSLDTGGRPPCFLNLGVPHAYIPHGHPNAILEALGLDGPGIASSIALAMDRWTSPRDHLQPSNPDPRS
ncbi:MAG: transketolase C-terminal domain-containing protein, partial [Acidimicrobiales bacterium]